MNEVKKATAQRLGEIAKALDGTTNPVRVSELAAEGFRAISDMLVQPCEDCASKQGASVAPDADKPATFADIAGV